MSATMSRSAPPPSHQEVTRKLSMHSKPPPKVRVLGRALSRRHLCTRGAYVIVCYSDSESVIVAPEASNAAPTVAIAGSALVTSPSSQPPALSAIAERRDGSGEESEEDEDEGVGGWRTVDVKRPQRGSYDETMLMSGYLWKKGERRKTWKRRWFVLRPAHLAFYKTDAEYKLLRLLDLNDVHTCTPVALKKHSNTFGLVSPTRTFYLSAETSQELTDWVKAISKARQALLATNTQASATAPVPIPSSTSHHHVNKPLHSAPPIVASSLSQSPHGHHLTSSDSDDASPAPVRHLQDHSPGKAGAVKDSPIVVLSGYLLKCGSRRHNWHKRWFVLSSEKLVYSRSHMDTKPHRQVPLAQILDALEYDLPSHRHAPSSTVAGSASPPQQFAGIGDGDDTHGQNTFKIVTTKRTLLVCAPSEEEEIKWLSAVRALIARRSEAGVVPGDATPVKLAPGAPAAGAGAGASMGTGAGKRRDSFARRLSLSGRPALGSVVVPQEAASERQS
ncbi:PH-domain-containing protein [Rhodofomes roseus]|uniref:PH-domain-containing protein n=1 Tax=Rhodofomes roseus TaxID=34475 RepID=A0ABQ8K3V0_9APHY|nr:PH-domain-containing protein [Rhodofomes roseus]KAH9831535.1 PH-domain-containing protein [Rhodofomes roseus]